MKHFFFTFGVGYAHEPHPYWSGAHPDGYLEVIAETEDAARLMVRALIGLKWGAVYDQRPEWAKRGALALVTHDGRIWQVEGVEPPTPRFTESDPEFYGVDRTDEVAARIEGELAEHSDRDAIENLGYEVELVHKGCLNEGLSLFKHVTEVDSRVQAGELDWNSPHHCEVCQESIT
jgi:hypothetical protein